MQAIFYSFSKRKNSTAIPSEEGTEIEIKLKNGCSFLSPIFLLQSDSFVYNYCKFNERFYWVNDVVSIRDNLFEVHCSVDVLGTWKESIKATKAMVEYSASDNDQNINDPRNVVTVQKTRTATNVYPEEFDEGGSFILCTMSGSASDAVAESFSTLYGLNAGSLGALSQEFNSEDVYTALRQFLDNPLDTIIFCRWVPVPLVSGPTRVVPVKFGTYESAINGTLITQNQKTFTVQLAIPWQKTDFRAVEPYTTGSLYLPGVGEVSLNLEPLRGIAKLNLYVTIDYVTNGIHYTIADPTTNNIYGTYSGSVGVDIPVSAVQSGNVSGVLAGLGTAVGGIATGRFGLAAGGFAAAGVASFSQNIKSTGNFGGGYNVKSGSMVIRLELIRSQSVQEPSEYVATIGNPCMKVREIEGLTGYCQTRNFEVSGNMTAQEKSAINNAMDGGVYLE